MRFNMNESPQLSAIWICTRFGSAQRQALVRYLEALDGLGCRVELVIVGNGAFEQSGEELKELLADTNVPARVLRLHRECDASTAIQIGLKPCRGKYVALLPEYMQTDPTAIECMLEVLEGGADYVASWRNPRVDSSWNSLQSRIFNGLTRYLTGVPVHDLNSGLRLMKKEVMDSVPIYGDLDRFLPVLASTQGYVVREVETRHLTEQVNKGDYRLGVYLRRALDLVTLFFLFKFTRKPLRFFGLLGSTSIGLGVLTTSVVSVQRLLGTPLADRPLLVFGTMLIVLGVQSFSLGLLGELIIFTYGKKLRHHHVETIYGGGARQRRGKEHPVIQSS